VPQFYELSADRLPRRWIQMMKQSLMELAPYFNTNRMMQEYTEKFYQSASQRYHELAANDYRRARELAAWKLRVAKAWKDVRIVAVEFDRSRVFQVDETLQVKAEAFLGGLEPADVILQIYFGPLNETGEIVQGETVVMNDGVRLPSGNHLYHKEIRCRHSGRHGFGVRILPSHPDLVTNFDLGVITWA
jgi:starch phosphorylase